MKVKDFNDKVCWITGASSGIGAALTVALNDLGAHLIITARTTENLQQVKNNCSRPENVYLLASDMEETGGLEGLSIAAWNIFSRIDFVFLNAGMAVRDLIIDTKVELIKKVLTVNFLSAVIITKTLLPFMKQRGSGRFVVTSSLSGKYGIPKLAAYSSSKHALHGFFESLRAEHCDDGISVTMIIPGLVKTNISINALQGDGNLYGKMQDSIATGISPVECARKIIKAVSMGKNEALIGGPEIFSVLIKRMFPKLFSLAMSKHPVKALRKLGLFKKRLGKEV